MAHLARPTTRDDQRPADKPVNQQTWQAVSGLSRTVLFTGLLLVAFAAYQAWGAGWQQRVAQRELADQASTWADPAADETPPIHHPGSVRVVLDLSNGAEAEAVDAPLISGVIPSGSPAAASITPAQPALAEGEAFVTLTIPSIDLQQTVVEGTSSQSLRMGPGHYRGTAQPGQSGNLAIAGHRTTHGAPFRHIDQLAPGDRIVVENALGTFAYQVEGHPNPRAGSSPEDPRPEIGHRIVDPEAVEVLADHGDHRLTLTACHPLHSARERIIVTAILVESPAGPVGSASPDQPETTPINQPVTTQIAVPDDDPSGPPASASQLAGQSASTPRSNGVASIAHPPASLQAGPDQALGQPSPSAPSSAPPIWRTLWWAAATAGIVLAAKGLGLVWRRGPAYAVAAPPFSLALVTFFSHLDLILPPV